MSISPQLATIVHHNFCSRTIASLRNSNFNRFHW